MGMNSQNELARASGVSKQAICNFENGVTKNPMSDTLADVSHALECNTAWLWRGDGDPPSYLDARPYTSAFMAGYLLGSLGVLSVSIEWPITNNAMHSRWFNVGILKGDSAARVVSAPKTGGAL
jgi:transcriptional regulator with XRE-family HTH domain